MKKLLILMLGTGSIALGQVVDTAENVAKKTAEKTKEAAETVAHGVKKGVDKVADALTPDTDAARVDVTIDGDNVDMPADLRPGKTAFVVKNNGKTTQNFEVIGGDIDRKFMVPPGPGETKVLHVTLHRGRTYTVYSTNPDDGKWTKKLTLNVK
jgi:hypothetical protein